MKSFILLIFSALLSLVVVEGLLRLFVSPSSLYATIHTAPELNEWKNALQFWERYSPEVASDAVRSFASYDPVLGWDFEQEGDRIKGDEDFADTVAEGVTRILAIGDSYTYGLDVAEQENFAAILAMIPDVEVLNMSIPGYGIDQAYLKYRDYGARYAPQVIIFGVYVSDYERSSIGFTTFAKPVFIVNGDQIDLRSQVVPPPIAELQRVERKIAQKIYLVEMLRNVQYKLRRGSAQREDFFNDMDPLITHVFRLLQGSLRANQRLLIVHIPRAESFNEAEPLAQGMHRHLLAIYKALNLDVINLAEAFLVENSAQEVYRNYYVHRNNGSVGHFSTRGHRRVAELITAELGL